MNAREFVLSLANQLVQQGRTVEIEEERNYIHIYTLTHHMMENALAASAHLSATTGRWNFEGVRVYRTHGQPVMCNTRKRARTVVDVYGQSYRQQAVTA